MKKLIGPVMIFMLLFSSLVAGEEAGNLTEVTAGAEATEEAEKAAEAEETETASLPELPEGVVPVTWDPTPNIR